MSDYLTFIQNFWDITHFAYKVDPIIWKTSLYWNIILILDPSMSLLNNLNIKFTFQIYWYLLRLKFLNVLPLM